MEIEFDPAKNQRNQESHGLNFEDVPDLNWSDAVIIEDTRKDYGETRYRAFLRDEDNTPYSVAFTQRGGAFRIISFRRAHEKERKYYGQ